MTVRFKDYFRGHGPTWTRGKCGVCGSDMRKVASFLIGGPPDDPEYDTICFVCLVTDIERDEKHYRETGEDL